MKKLIVNENCIGCGACVAIDGSHFDFDSVTGLSTVINNDNLDSNEVKNAIASCPVGAIKIIDEDAETNASCDGCAGCNGGCSHHENSDIGA